jgi:hypothetical protein
MSYHLRTSLWRKSQIQLISNTNTAASQIVSLYWFHYEYVLKFFILFLPHYIIRSQCQENRRLLLPWTFCFLQITLSVQLTNHHSITVRQTVHERCVDWSDCTASPVGTFLPRLQAKDVYVYFTSPMAVTFPANFIPCIHLYLSAVHLMTLAVTVCAQLIWKGEKESGRGWFKAISRDFLMQMSRIRCSFWYWNRPSPPDRSQMLYGLVGDPTPLDLFTLTDLTELNIS